MGQEVGFSEAPKYIIKQKWVWSVAVRECFVVSELGPWRIEGILCGHEREWDFENWGWVGGLGWYGKGEWGCPRRVRQNDEDSIYVVIQNFDAQ